MPMEKGNSVLTQQHIKQLHLKQIFLSALNSGGISRAELRQQLGLSFPAVTALVEELLAAKLLFADGTLAHGERGRPRSLLRVNSAALAIPVAALTAEGYCCCLYGSDLRLLSRVFLPIAGQDITDPLAAWLGEVKRHHPVTALVLTFPGNLDRKGALSSSVLGFSTGERFLERLNEGTGLRVFAYNNADCAAYGEKYCQELPEDYIFVSVSRGVGAGIIRRGKLFSGGIHRAGEIGHISIDYRGRPCSCGGKGCLERYIGMEQILQEAFPEGNGTLEMLCARFEEKDPRITALLEEKAQLLALGIRNMLAMQPVRHIILGGQLCRLGEPFRQLLNQCIPQAGLGKYMEQVTVSLSRNTAGEIPGALRIYLDHDLTMDAFPAMRYEL